LVIYPLGYGARTDVQAGHLREYFESMVEGMGRRERRRVLELHLTRLLLDEERKSVEPMAGRLVEEARKREAVGQWLQQGVSVADWSARSPACGWSGRLLTYFPHVLRLISHQF
jgi:SRSO17 transposase